MSRRAESSLRYTRATEVASLRSVRRTRPPRRWAARLRASPSPLRTNRYCLVLPTHVPSRSGIDSWTARLFGGRARPVTGYHVAVCVHDPYRACSRQRCEVRDETDRLALLSILGRGHKHRRPDVHGVSYSARMGNTRWVYPDKRFVRSTPLLQSSQISTQDRTHTRAKGRRTTTDTLYDINRASPSRVRTVVLCRTSGIHRASSNLQLIACPPHRPGAQALACLCTPLSSCQLASHTFQHPEGRAVRSSRPSLVLTPRRTHSATPQTSGAAPPA